ncbi:MAG: 2-oxo acid dehydrogenase subunit E2 [Treponema sp.]|nr:2-oxo acid dehydrogenase subunit E2 [Treponema sp.]
MSKNEETSKKRKNRLGDRKDAWLVRGLTGLPILMPFMYPNKCDNEAFIRETIDLTAINEYLEKKNQNLPYPEFQYKVFHVIVAAFAKTVTHRPKLNRFVQGQRLWDRKELSQAFMVKKQFTDESKEGIAYLTFPQEGDPNADYIPIDYVYHKLYKIINPIKKGGGDSASDAIDILTKFPHFIVRAFMALLSWLDFHGWVPASLMKGDPSYCTVFLSNLGSIKLNAGYHHLANRGSNSIFVTVGEYHKTPCYDENGNMEMHMTLDLGITLDERIADGYYYSKSIKLLKHLLAHPELLDAPVTDVVDYEGK